MEFVERITCSCSKMMHFRFFMKDVVKDSRAHHLGSWRSWKYTSKETLQFFFFDLSLFESLTEALQGTSSTFSRPAFQNPSDEMQKIFLLPVFPTKMPQRITSEDLTFERKVFSYFESKSDHRSTGASKKSKAFTIHFGTSLGCGFER